MRRAILMILAGIFVLPNLCESYLSVDAKIEKGHGGIKGGGGGNIHKSDSVSVDYDAFTGTITISTTSESKNVDIKIYKDGALMYADNDKVGKTAALNYTLTEEEIGEYNVCVDVEGRESMEETIVKE
jgi:hypothetical protein